MLSLINKKALVLLFATTLLAFGFKLTVDNSHMFLGYKITTFLEGIQYGN